MNINSQLEEGQKEAGVLSSRYFKFTKGDNRIRILTEGKIIATHFFGKGVPASTCYGEEKGCPFHGKNAPVDKDGKVVKPAIKYTCYLLNIKDRTNLDNNEVELADLPYSVIKQVGDYQNNVDYAFTSFPMPYDVTVTLDPDASPVNMYKVIASPKREEVSDIVKGKLAELMQFTTPEQLVQKKKDYQIRKHTEEGKIVKLKSKEELNKEYREKVASGQLEDDGQMPEYPTESISPDDISF